MIDAKLIPESSLMDLDRAIYNACVKFYQNPENRKAFEKWQKERNAGKNQSSKVKGWEKVKNQ